MAARNERACHGIPRQHGADRQSSPQPLGECHDVGLDPGVLIREEPPGPPYPRLDLIQDQENLSVRTELPESWQVVIVRYPHAALALDRLHQYGTGPRIDR